jgi:hypothetical protein
MPCDEGRTRAVLKWCLVDGNGDDDFRQKQRNAQAGVATGDTALLQGSRRSSWRTMTSAGSWQRGNVRLKGLAALSAGENKFSVCIAYISRRR